MEVLSERLRDGKEQNAFTIRSIHKPYTVKVDCEPVLKFKWNLNSESWDYCPSRFNAYSTEMLNPDEILIRVPLDDNTPVTHKPYVDDLSNPEVLAKMENAISMVAQLPEPACAMNLKKALIAVKSKQNR